MAKIYGALEVAQLEWFTDAGKPAASSYIYRVIYVSDLKQVMVSDGSNWIPFLNTSTNQTVNGNITFAGQQIFNGLHRLSVTTDSSSTGAVTALNNVTPVIEFTGAVTSISGIVNSASGATVMLVNRTGSTLAILDEDAGATAANRIRTGTGAQVALANNASVILTYVGDNRWHIVGGSGSSTGGSGGINYITNGTAEADTVGWAVYADAAGTSPVDGTGGSANVTITRTTTTPLVGTASFLLAKDAANRQGQGWSYDFTIDLANRAKVLQISFDYLVNSGTFVAGATGSNSDVTVWIYDVTNAVVIQPSNIKLFSNSASISDKFQASFQTSSNSSNYRLILHVASTSASAYTLEVDSVSVSPSDYVFGTPVTDWQSYTPTFQGFGTPTNVEMRWRRVGDNVEIQGRFTSGTTTAVEARVGLPTGLTSSSSKISTIQQTGTVGFAVSAGYYLTLMEPSKTYFTIGIQVSSAGLTKLNASSIITSGNILSFTASIPIEGWSSSVQTSDSADTRVVDLVADRSGTQSVTADVTNVTFSTVLRDSHGAWSGSVYTAPVSGDYFVSAITTNSGTSQSNVRIFKNGSVFRIGTYASGTPTVTIAIVPCVAGDTISIRDGFTQTLGGGSVYISRISGPSAIAASESLNATYFSTTGQQFNFGVSSWVDFPTRKFDTHLIYTAPSGTYSAASGAWSVSQPRWTAPISGKYQINASIGTTSGAAGVGEYRSIEIVLNGTTSLKQSTQNSTSYAAYLPTQNISTIIQMNAGDYIQIRYNQQNSVSAARTMGGGESNNYIDIVRVGN